jgi:hypothetical protein
MRFMSVQVLMAVTVVWQIGNNISEEYVTFIFRVFG